MRLCLAAERLSARGLQLALLFLLHAYMHPHARHGRWCRYHADDPDSVVITHGAPTGFEASLIRSPSSPIRRLKVGFIEALVPSHLAQPDIARCVTACTARLRRVAVHAFGADAVIDLASPNMPVFGSEWVTAVGAFRSACRHSPSPLHVLPVISLRSHCVISCVANF